MRIGTAAVWNRGGTPWVISASCSLHFAILFFLHGDVLLTFLCALGGGEGERERERERQRDR